jgi:glycosyltransferase involved in cell wall biosynthesis
VTVPSISVIIPTYNSATLVPQAIDSVLAQTVPVREILVLDDGSTDDTRQRVAGYPASVRYLWHHNQGVSATRNRGVREASGELIAFLDADDVWHPRKLELQLHVLADNPQLALLGTNTFEWPAPVYPDTTVPSPQALCPVEWQSLTVKNYFTTSSIIVRREVLERVGPFDTALQGPEDYDLWLRIAHIAPVANLRLPLAGYRIATAGSLSKQARTMQDGMRRILRKLDQRKLWHGDWLLRQKAYSYCDYSCAYMYAAAGARVVAVGNLLRSLTRYPLPFRRSEVRMSFARFKLLGMTLWRMISGAGTV